MIRLVRRYRHKTHTAINVYVCVGKVALTIVYYSIGTYIVSSYTGITAAMQVMKDKHTCFVAALGLIQRGTT